MAMRNAFAALSLDESEESAQSEGSRKSKAAKKKSKAATSESTVAEESAAVAAERDGTSEPPSQQTADRSDTRDKLGQLSEPLVWIDCEMTGLVRSTSTRFVFRLPRSDTSFDVTHVKEVETCTILEIACLLTDGNLETVIHGPEIVIHHSEEVLAGMNDWCIEHHGKSGLTQRVRESTVSLQEAETQVLTFVQRYTLPGCVHLAGNSVHCDLSFLKRYMPNLAAHLHYRIVDVSSVRELARRWFPNDMRKAPRKELRHTAKADILESLTELKWLRKTVFKTRGGGRD